MNNSLSKFLIVVSICVPLLPLSAPSACNGNDRSKISRCCEDNGPCNIGEGDCNNDDECIGDLRCGKDNCRRRFASDQTNWRLLSDCCFDPSSQCDGTYWWGINRCCSNNGPCSAGQGHCREDSECGRDLKCGDKNCMSDFSTDKSAWLSFHSCCVYLDGISRSTTTSTTSSTTTTTTTVATTLSTTTATTTATTSPTSTSTTSTTTTTTTSTISTSTTSATTTTSSPSLSTSTTTTTTSSTITTTTSTTTTTTTSTTITSTTSTTTTTTTSTTTMATTSTTTTTTTSTTSTSTTSTTTTTSTSTTTTTITPTTTTTTISTTSTSITPTATTSTTSTTNNCQYKSIEQEHVVVDEGTDLGVKYRISLDECIEFCRQTRGCNSFAICSQPDTGACWLKDKVISLSQPIEKKDKCTTYYYDCDTDAQCPDTHRFAFHGGDYCCYYDKSYWGSPILLTDTTCRYDYYTACPGSKCKSNLGDCMDRLPYDYGTASNDCPPWGWNCQDWAGKGSANTRTSYCSYDWSTFRFCVPETTGLVSEYCQFSCGTC